MPIIRLVLLLNFLSYSFLAVGQDTLHLFFTGDIHGVIKSETPNRHGDILRIEAAMKAYFKAEELSRNDYLLFDTGDALAPFYLSQLDSGRTVMRHLRRAGYDGLTAGNLDFKYGLEHIQAFDHSDSLFSVFATNIYQKDTAVLAQYRIYERQGLRIGVVGLVEPRAATSLFGSMRQSLRIRPPVEAMKPILDSLRPRCDLIVAINHMDLNDNLELCRRLPGIDLVVSKASADSLRYLQVFDHQARPRSLIVTAPVNALGIGHLQIRHEKGAQGSRLSSIELQTPIPADTMPLKSLDLGDHLRLEEAFQDFIRKKYDGQPPDRWLLKATTDFDQDLMDYALYVLLRSTRSEIAMLNYGALLPGLGNRRKGFLSIRDIESMTRPDDLIVTLRLPGKAIRALANRGKGFPKGDDNALRLMAVGDYRPADHRGPNPHGRKLEDNEIYTVVTILYLAEGGAGYDEFKQGAHLRRQFTGSTRLLPAEEPEGRSMPLSDLLIRHLLGGLHPNFPDDLPFYEADPFLNRPLVQVKFENLDFSFKSVRVGNNEAFTNANDKRVSASTRNATNIASSGYLAAILRTPATRWENGALIRYAFQQIGSSDIQESDDRFELQTILDWDDPLDWYEQPGKLNLYASLRYDTEFTRPRQEGQQPVFRRQDGFFYLGVSRFASNNRELRFAFFAKNNFSRNDRDAGFELNFKYFRRVRNMNHGSIMRARYLFNQPRRPPGSERALIDYTGYLEFNFIQFVNLKPQVNIFLFQDMGLKKIASNIAFSLNLSFSRQWKPQYVSLWKRE